MFFNTQKIFKKLNLLFFIKMRLHRNIAVGIIEGLENILIDKIALKPALNKLLKKQKMGSKR